MIHPSIKFYLIKRRATQAGKELESHRLIMSVCYQGTRMVYYTGIVTSEAFWNGKDQCFLSLGPQYQDYNIYLHKLREYSRVIYHSLAYKDGLPRASDFRKQLQNLKLSTEADFFQYFLDFTEEKRNPSAMGSYLKCMALYKHLVSFRDQYEKRISLASVDVALLQAFCNYLEKRGFSGSTIASYIMVLKWFLNWAWNRGLLLSNAYRSFALKKQASESEKHLVFLYPEELQKISQLEISDAEKRRIRDAYLFISHSGISYHEFLRLRKSDIDEEGISIKGQKARFIKHSGETLELYRSYKNRFYRGDIFIQLPATQLVNSKLRLVCKTAGLTREIQTRRKGKYAHGNLYELITIQSAQNTFLSFAYTHLHPLEIKKRSGFRKDVKMEMIAQELEKGLTNLKF